VNVTAASTMRFVFGVDVVDGEGGQGDAFGDHRFPVYRGGNAVGRFYRAVALRERRS
jgi:hypothetical protein